MPDTQSNLEDHPALNEAHAQLGDQVAIVDYDYDHDCVRPINEDVSQSESYREEREDVEGQKRQRLVPPLLDEYFPDVHDAKSHEEGVESDEHVAFHCVDHVLCLGKPGLCSIQTW